MPSFKKSGLRRSLVATASMAAFAASAGSALAQAQAPVRPPAEPYMIQELVITAEKREQALQDVPVAVSAFTSEQRDTQGITNIQDFVMIHEGAAHPTIIGEDCSITHHVTLHGCEIGDRCLIGIGAVIMDGAKIGDNSIVAGNAIVTEGAEFPPNSVIGGVPAKLLATRDNSEANLKNAEFYSANAAAYAAGSERLVED